MKWSSVKYLAKEGLKNIWLNRIMSLASVCVLMSCLVLTGSATVFVSQVNKFVKNLDSRNKINVFLDLNATEWQSKKIGEEIQKVDNVATCQFISKEKALEKFSKSLGELNKELQEEDSFLPDSYIITLKDSERYKETIEEIKKIDGVDIITDRSETANKLSILNRTVKNIGFAITIALGAVSLFIIANTIKITMYGRRLEISIMKSVGATNWFIRVPFIVEGVVIGLISSLLSLLIIRLIYKLIVKMLSKFMSFVEFPTNVISWDMALIFVAVGAVFGIAGGCISIRKYLKIDKVELFG